MKGSGCGIDLELLEKLFEGFLLDNLAKLKDVICCDGGNNGGGNQVDKFLSDFDITENTMGSGDKVYTFIMTMNDGAKYTRMLTIPANTPNADEFLKAATYNITRGLVLTMQGGQEHIVNIPVATGIEFDSGTRALTLNLSDGSKHVTVVPAGQGGGTPGTDNDTKVSALSFNDGTRTLTVTSSDGDQKSVVIPAGGAGTDNDTKVTGISHNNGDLTVTLSDGTSVQTSLPQRGIRTINFSKVDKKLIVTRDDGTQVETIIDIDGGGAPGTDNDTKVTDFKVDGSNLKLTLSDNTEFTVAIPGTAPTFTISTAVASSTRGTDLSTTVFGNRDFTMGRPAAWTEVMVGGNNYLIPLYTKQ